jgi:uncharacterized protein
VSAEPVTIRSGPLALEGILQLPEEAAAQGILVVCHPHPLYGGSMHNNVVDALCDAALQEGLSALRFNFRGVGGSEGDYGGGDSEQDDVLAALDYARERQPGASIGLAGYSFGAAIAARSLSRLDSAPSCVILVSPPLATLASQLMPAASDFWLVLTGDQDHVCPAAELDAIAERLMPGAQIVVIDGADHSWWGHEPDLRDTAGSFLRWHLIKP